MDTNNKLKWLSLFTMFIGIISFFINGWILEDITTDTNLLYGYWEMMVWISSILGIVGVILGILCGEIASNDFAKLYRGVGSTLSVLSLGISFFLQIILTGPHGGPPLGGRVSRVKGELQSLATALEYYYIDNNAYPLPDYDNDGNQILPKALSTPVAFITSRFHDPFNHRGKGFYGYGIHNSTSNDSSDGWILTSYGPDKVDGNSSAAGGTKMDFTKAWSDKTLGFSLEVSGLTYDPTNGILSSGDIWRRGPYEPFTPR